DRPYLAEPFGQFADLVARPSPSPAAGSVAAGAVALAAALAAKAARLSMKQVPDAEAVAGELDGLRSQATALADEDARAYAGVLAAIRESGSGSSAARSAWEVGTRVPLAIAQ